MAGFLQSLKDQYRAHVLRHENLPFLRACMAACALVATADGRVSFTQRVRVDQILETLDQLSVFDPHEGVNLFVEFAETILDNPKEGHASVLRELSTAMEERETAELLIRICLAVAEANGETSLPDQIEIVTLCSHLAVDPAGFSLYRDELLKARDARAG
jgi:tellurite resistance protein TerB